MFSIVNSEEILERMMDFHGRACTQVSPQEGTFFFFEPKALFFSPRDKIETSLTPHFALSRKRRMVPDVCCSTNASQWICAGGPEVSPFHRLREGGTHIQDLNFLLN